MVVNKKGVLYLYREFVNILEKYNFDDFLKYKPSLKKQIKLFIVDDHIVFNEEHDISICMFLEKDDDYRWYLFKGSIEQLDIHIKNIIKHYNKCVKSNELLENSDYEKLRVK